MKWLSVAVVLASTLTTCEIAAAKTEVPRRTGSDVVRLWPKERLAATAGGQTEQSTTRGGVTRVTDVTDPTITVRKPDAKIDTGAAVIVCPGGGYGILAIDKEGTEVLAWLNKIGVTGILLKYRVPRQRDAALQDAQRAVGLVRSRAAEWQIDAKRIGILGFSAGGHLAARVATNYGTRAYQAVDAADAVSCRPDFAILIYPAYLTTKADAALDAKTLPVDAKTPSTFLAVAGSDRFTPGSLHYFMALRAAKVSSELHVYQFGGHGCGLRRTEANLTGWPVQCRAWLEGLGVIPRSK